MNIRTVTRGRAGRPPPRYDAGQEAPMGEGRRKLGLVAAIGCLGVLFCLGCGGMMGTWYWPVLLQAASSGAGGSDWDD
jgi:hypothetical protein